MGATVAAAKLRGDTRGAVASATAYLADKSLSGWDRLHALFPLDRFRPESQSAVPILIHLCNTLRPDKDLLLYYMSRDLLFKMAPINADARRAVAGMIARYESDACEWSSRQGRFKQ